MPQSSLSTNIKPWVRYFVGSRENRWLHIVFEPIALSDSFFFLHTADLESLVLDWICRESVLKAMIKV